MKYTNQQKRLRRHIRIRTKVKGTTVCPRLSLYRGQGSLIAQLIDDQTNNTLIYLTDRVLGKKSIGTPTERATVLGKKIGEAIKAKSITTVVFDRGGWRYHGRIKAFAEAVRAVGIKF